MQHQSSAFHHGDPNEPASPSVADSTTSSVFHYISGRNEPYSDEGEFALTYLVICLPL
jgi:hypothetical protein